MLGVSVFLAIVEKKLITNMKLLLSFILFLVVGSQAAPIMFVIQTQPSSFHLGLAEQTKYNILKQWRSMVKSQEPPEIIFSTELGDKSDFAWTYFPIVSNLAEKLEENPGVDFVGFLRENTNRNLAFLCNFAKTIQGKVNPREESLFYGKGLKDESPTIIHHFHQNKEDSPLLFPDPEAGIFMSRHLILNLLKNLPDKQDFNIDPEFELSLHLSNALNVKLTHVKELCAKAPTRPESCITHPRIKEYKCLKNKEVEKTKDFLNSVFIRVSTVQKYHQSRVTKILQTYGDLIANAEYISDTSEEIADGVTTVVLPNTVNTENGHCNKTRTMLDSFLESGSDWMLILDDDTILSPARFAQFLACFDDAQEPVILGQRYGYGSGTGTGYNYITGGGGKIINRVAALKIVDLKDSCACPSADTPEDMHIFGICALKAEIPILHSHRMFQARPPDYPSAMVTPRKPISFHKHWEIDPVEVYDQWFRKADEYLRTDKKVQDKDEL